MKIQGVIKKVNEAVAKVLGVNTFEEFCSMKLQGVKTLVFSICS